MMGQQDLLGLDNSRTAVLSPCSLYRYRRDEGLGRDGPSVALVGVNPSIATHEVDDQTIRKDRGFGKRLGWRRFIKVNKFAFRATDVRELATAVDPNGPNNDDHLRMVMRECDMLVGCWGPLAKLPKHLRGRWLEVVAMAREEGRSWHCFGTAQDGQPRHTLMLPYGTPLVPWMPPK